MKILVDKTPESPKECTYSSFTKNTNGDTWYGCTRGSIACPIPDKACPYFTDLHKTEEAETKLKPCPFCGGDVTITKENSDTHESFCVVECEYCGATVSFVNSTGDGTNAWNCGKVETIINWNRRY